jgi:hypothetical protein
MMGNGDNDFSRSGPDWDCIYHFFLLLTSDTEMTKDSLIKTKKKSVGIFTEGVMDVFSYAGQFSDRPTKGSNPFYRPHGGKKWGNKFTVKQYRLDKNSRKRRFVPRTKGAKKNVR